jgi:hypothetical protein
MAGQAWAAAEWLDMAPGRAEAAWTNDVTALGEKSVQPG